MDKTTGEVTVVALASLTGRLCHGRPLFHQFTRVLLYIELGYLKHTATSKSQIGFCLRRYIFSFIHNGLTFIVPMTRTNFRFPWLCEIPKYYSFSPSSLERTEVAAVEGLYNDGIATLAGSQS